MKRTLSSFATFFVKVATLWICAVLGILALLGLVRSSRILEGHVDRPMSRLESIGFFLMWLSITLVIVPWALRLRRDYWRQIFVPFEDIAEVEHLVMRRSEEVTLNFRRETALG